MTAKWTEHELQFLSDNAGLHGYDYLCNVLGRSKNAIKLHACRNKIRFHDNIYTYSLLAQELGKSRASIRKYYAKNWLQGKKATWKSVYGQHPMIFTEDNIVKFLRSKHYLFSWHSMPSRYFANIVKHCTEKT